ncbi:UPF0104 family protein [Methanothermobacter wolfeii]|uniref:UPF0104 family protein n=1 Tax=Methanothermobacter wolfeii TaxID=145261 RepID=A0ABU8TUY1_METWO|nr:UPF0104 family protein [Methanothermobacter sp. THM-1]QHN06630.1 UPF0104 family protein [Methanothermobacter sp. THM-1]SCM57790.1 UPF0104 membrane protein [Methanothermobacter wolfeii]
MAEKDVFAYLRENRKTIIFSFLAVAVIIFLISFFAGFGDILAALEGTSMYFLALNFLFEAMILLLWTLRWRLILNLVDEAPAFPRLFMMLLASIFGNNITPGAAGGEPLRAYLLLEVEGTPFEIGFASSTADRVFEFVPFALISILSAVLIMTWDISLWTRLTVSFLIFTTIVIFSLAIYVGMNTRIAQSIAISVTRRLVSWISRFRAEDIKFSGIHDRVMFYIKRFTDGFSMTLRDRRVFVLGFFISLMMWFLDVCRLYICFMAVGVSPPMVPLIIIYTGGILISLLPLLPGSLGLREGILVALFAVAGIGADYVMAASVIDRIASYAAPTLAGLLAALYYGRHIADSH